MRKLLGVYGINHVNQALNIFGGINQVEATNNALLRILSRMVYEEPKR